MSSTAPPDPQVQRILSLDGGPSAALTIRLFRTIEMRYPGFLASADVFAGTSDGSFMALYLASRLNDDTEHNLRVLDGAIELSNDILRVLNIKLLGFLSGLLGAWAFQQSSGLEELLERTYGSMTLADLDKKVVICSVVTKGMRGVVFHNFDPRPTNRVSMVDAAMASSAFPVLMPRHKLNYGEYLDGAMAANNPTMAATIRVAQNMSGVIDNGDPGGGGECMANGVFGVCKAGKLHCNNGSLKCVPGQAQPETCNGLDDNCNGLIDDPPLADAPVAHQGQEGWLLQHVGGRFQLLLCVPTVESLGAEQREHFGIMYLDSQHRLIAFQVHFTGTLTQTSVYPREVVWAALQHFAAAVVLTHNHPSGVATPSRADEALTQTLKVALALMDVRLLDHVIVAPGAAVSMAEHGLI